MSYFVRLVRWTDYLGGLLALLSVDERYAQTSLDRSEAEALVLEWGSAERRSSDRITIAKARRENDPKVVALKDQLNAVYAKRKLFEVMYESVDRDANAVSRELTRRVGREPKERRADRWNP